jgi:hypothetical protein
MRTRDCAFAKGDADMQASSPQHYGSALVAALFKKAAQRQGGGSQSAFPDEEKPCRRRYEAVFRETEEKFREPV